MATKIEILKSKEGVELKEVTLVKTGEIIYYEIYIDGDWINKFKSKRVALSMWKDFAGC